MKKEFISRGVGAIQTPVGPQKKVFAQVGFVDSTHLSTGEKGI